MVDMFPFPSVTEGTPEKQIAEILNYLIQFKETLEFALANISLENLSHDLIQKLNELGTNIEKSNANREEEITQISVNTLTIADVCESNLFKLAIEGEVANVVSDVTIFTFNIDFNTGELECVTSKISNITFNVNSDTGCLEYGT